MAFDTEQSLKSKVSAVDTNQQKSFVFYTDWCKILLNTPADMRHKIIDALLEFTVTGNKPENSELSCTILSLIIMQIERDREKWVATREARSKAGKRGNDVRWHRKTSQDVADVAVNDNDNVNVNDIKERANAPKKSISLTIEQRQEAFKETIAPYIEFYCTEMLNDFYEYWTEPSKSNGKKMRFEMECTWEIGRRLSRWAKHSTQC